MSITKYLFGKLPCGSPVTAYTLTNQAGASVKILDLGGIIAEINIPDRDGRFADCVMGFADVDGYLNGGGYHGALVGRYANRICAGKFILDGKEYTLAKNDNGINHLHGGDVGYNRKIWAVEAISGDPDTLKLSIVSEDGEEGYPGRLELTVTYTFGSDNKLVIHYDAVCDKRTIANFTNHAYFNLGGYDSGDILADLLYVDADRYTPVDNNLIPTGEVKDVAGTEFDFRTLRPIAGPYDHNFCLNADGTVKYIAELRCPRSGRMMKVYTDMPGVQVYNAVMMDGPVPFKGGYPQKKFGAVCLETQFWPDSPNHANFPSCVLDAGERYCRTTIYEFGTY